MKKVLAVELYKAFHNPYSIMALVIGLALSIWSAVETMLDVIPVMETICTLPDQYRSFDGLSVFYEWMGIASLGRSSSLFYAIWPILAVLPYGWSFWKERKTAMDIQMIVRCGRKQYFMGKYLAVFLSGGTVIAVPLLINLLLEMSYLPYVVPEITAGVSPIRNGVLFSKIYYQYPFIYSLLWCCIAFLLGGGIATLGMVSGKKQKLLTGAMLLPYVIIMAEELVLTFSGIPRAWEYSVLRMLLAGSGCRGVPVQLMVGCLLLLTAGMTLLKSRRDVL